MKYYITDEQFDEWKKISEAFQEIPARIAAKQQIQQLDDIEYQYKTRINGNNRDMKWLIEDIEIQILEEEDRNVRS